MGSYSLWFAWGVSETLRHTVEIRFESCPHAINLMESTMEIERAWVRPGRHSGCQKRRFCKVWVGKLSRLVGAANHGGL